MTAPTAVPPLRITDFPVNGPGGGRDNVRLLGEAVDAVLPPGRMVVIEVAHRRQCPCTDSRRALAACTCGTVDVTLRLHDPKTS